MKVHILTTCPYCQGEANLAIGEVENLNGNKYTYHISTHIQSGGGVLDVAVAGGVELEDSVRVLTDEIDGEGCLEPDVADEPSV